MFNGTRQHPCFTTKTRRKKSPLAYIINNCTNTHTFLNQWKIVWICSIQKVKISTETSDYKLISVLPILSKTFERIVLQQITNFIENNILYHQYQSGYRKHHSTLTILFNPFMHNVVKWSNILSKPCGVHTARFLKYVWPFYNITHEKVKLRNDIKKATKSGELTISIFGDYSKAFGTVDFIFWQWNVQT